MGHRLPAAGGRFRRRRDAGWVANRSAKAGGPDRVIQVSQELEELEWIPRPKALALRRLGIVEVGDLLTHYPRRYEDRHEFPAFPREESETPICLCGEVTKTSVRRFGG